MSQPTLPRTAERPPLPGDEFVAADPSQFNDVLLADRESPSEHSFDVVAPDGYLHATRDLDPTRGWVVGLNAPTTTMVELLMAATHEVGSRGGGLITWWRANAAESEDRLAGRAGFTRARTQYQMRVRLPVAFDTIPDETLTVADFDSDADADAWLELNNAAFEGHPDQSDWTFEQLASRTNTNWFDPTLFLTVRDRESGAMLGFNWLKVHEADPASGNPKLGEIYVIGVAPEAHGRGLGQLLTGLGLRRLHERGIQTAMLYVSSDNIAALALYEKFGFRIHRTDHAYTSSVPAP